MTQPLVAMLSDFSLSDAYVGVMKGVIAARCPDVQIIDITHDVSPQNITQGAYLLRTAYRYFPPHTVFLVVIDPGVGTERRPIAVQAAHGRYVGPDNGVFSLVLAEMDDWQAVQLEVRSTLSNTFHGRDLFAPVAADLACGSTLRELGTPVRDLVRVPPLSFTRRSASSVQGEVIHVDHFGNLITSIGPIIWRDGEVALQSADYETVFTPESAVVSLAPKTGTLGVVMAGRIGPLRRTYAEAAVGELVAYVGSDGQLEIAVNQGNAARVTGLGLGAPINLSFLPL